MDEKLQQYGKKVLKENANLFEDDLFCLAPFNQMYFGIGGEVRTCCTTRNILGNVNNNSIEEIINSDQAKKVRTDILNKKETPNCNSCIHSRKITGETNGVQAFSNNWVNFRKKTRHTSIDSKEAYEKATIDVDIVGKNINRVLSSVETDGHISEHKPLFLDILVSNKCNFACVGCNGELSSTINDKYNDISNLVNEHKSTRPNWQVDVDPIIEYIIKHKDSIRKIHLNGGEPFMQPQFHKLLQALIDEKLNRSIHLWSHTNGHITSYKGVDIVDKYFSHWQDNMTIVMSHDHYGDRGYYVRFPYQDKKWLSTYKRLDKIADVGVQTSYNIFNALTMQNLKEWYLDNNVPLYKALANPFYSPYCYTAWMLQYVPELHQKAVDQLKDIPANFNLLQSLNGDTSNFDLKELHTKFKQSIKMLDEKRQTNFLNTFPELEKFYLN